MRIGSACQGDGKRRGDSAMRALSAEFAHPLILLGVVGFLRTRQMPGAALITDHNYSTGFRQVRGLGHDGYPDVAGAANPPRAGDHGARRLRA